MAVTIPITQLYFMRDPAHFHDSMLEDVNVLWDANAFPSCVTLMACFIDALAAGKGKATKSRFQEFMERHFGTLCDELHSVDGRKSGAATFYEQYRNGLAHQRGPKSNYALARESEMPGKRVEVFDVENGGRLIGINVDRLYSDFHTAVAACRA